MVHDLPVARVGNTVGEVRESILTRIHSFSSIIYVYVVDEEGHLIGVLSIRELFEGRKDATIESVCIREDVASVHAGDACERVAYLALRRNIKAIPVIDAERTLLGVIPPDALLRILYREMHEDQLHMAGIHHRGVHHEQGLDSILTISLGRSLLHRLPWLFLGMLGGLLAAKIIGSFEQTLEGNLLLAAFIPLVVYMSSAVGLQMESFIIRDLALDRRLPFHRYFVRQFLIIACMAAILAGLGFLSSFALHGQSDVSLVLGVSLFAAILSSLLTGLLIPYVFSRFRMDPANASGPTATIVQDLLSITIYFAVATSML